jgi:hypothetical protein
VRLVCLRGVHVASRESTGSNQRNRGLTGRPFGAETRNVVSGIQSLVAVALVAICAAGGRTHATAATSDVACILGLHSAGVHVARAARAVTVACVRDACRGRLAAGTSIEACVAADRGGRVARARRRTVAIEARRCPSPPPFGPKSAQEVNDAFAAPLRVRALFGPDAAAMLAARPLQRATVKCQIAMTRALARVAAAELDAFDRCAHGHLRRGLATSAEDLRDCVGARPDRVARVRATAGARVRRECRGVAIAAAAPGECASAAPDGVGACIGDQGYCQACNAVDTADHLPGVCGRFVDGIAVRYCGDRPTTSQSVARQWDEEILSAIRRDNPRPPVHARNLFHLSVAMWDAWVAYDTTAVGVLTHERVTSADPAADRAVAISFAAYRLLAERYGPALALGADVSEESFDARMSALGLDPTYTDTTGSGPAALGNRIAAAVIAFGRSDGSNEDANYADPGYTPMNDPLVVKVPDLDFATVHDPNRWQPLALDVMIGQNGVPLPGKVQKFVGSQWGAVAPFALTRGSPSELYLDPGPQPTLSGPDDATFKAQVQQVIELSSRLTPDDPTLIDVSPSSYGNNPLGSNSGTGYAINPVTGLPYTSQLVKRGDFGRVIAEYWADGPVSETPPGHWNVIANLVADTPGFERRLGGTGPALDPLEWDVKTYLAVDGAVHDAAIACWGAKRVYDGVRPITMIRFMGKKGQSSDPGQPSYDPMGLPLEPGVIELITPQSSAPGERHAALVGPEVGGQVGDVAVLAWPGGPADPTTQHRGVQWVLARSWKPYQRDTFVTPAFPGYFSGHSTFSRSAAEVMTLLTGSEYFPGGLGEFTARQNAFLQFERGPSTDVTLQWARYFDAADQAGQSRLWGGIHVQADDFTGRTRGHLIGIAAFDKARTYFDGTAPP